MVVAQLTAQLHPVPEDPEFESSHRQLLLSNLLFKEKTKRTERPGMAHLKEEM